jgi:FkbM family methyltransferase
MSEERRQARVFQNGNPFADAQRHLAPRPIRTVVDGGANVGDVTAHLLANFPTATIYAFEPDPDCWQSLQQRYADQRRVIASPLGLSRDGRPLVLHRYAESGLNSVQPLSAGAEPYLQGYGTAAQGSLTVPMTTLDQYCEQNGLSEIDFVKLDLQGWEIACLEGARNLLTSGRIGAVYAEVNFVALYHGQVYYEDLALFLREYGYRLFSLYALSFTATDQLAWADALFLKP